DGQADPDRRPRGVDRPAHPPGCRDLLGAARPVQAGRHRMVVRREPPRRPPHHPPHDRPHHDPPPHPATPPNRPRVQPTPPDGPPPGGPAYSRTHDAASHNVRHLIDGRTHRARP